MESIITEENQEICKNTNEILDDKEKPKVVDENIKQDNKEIQTINEENSNIKDTKPEIDEKDNKDNKDNVYEDIEEDD